MLSAAFDSLSSRSVLLFGGKGGVGKTTIAVAAALHFSQTRPVVLFTTDPASSLSDLLGSGAMPNERLVLESLDAAALYARFLGENLASFVEIGDRGTYLDRGELQRLLELSLPGVDELMAWMHIGELHEGRPEAMLVVDTAPTGHTLRMLSSGEHFHQMATALDAMQEKHRALVQQFTRRDVRDAMDAFIDAFEERAAQRRALLADPRLTAFLPVFLSEPLVVEQTQRLIRDVGIDVPFAILNRAIGTPDCERDRARADRDREARASLVPVPVVEAMRSCTHLDSAERIADWCATGSVTGGIATGSATLPLATALDAEELLKVAPLTFLAGKGGVGKTSCATSIALQLAEENPGQQFVILSVDPAHSLRDLFAQEPPPSNLAVETIDTRARWERFRTSIGSEIDEAIRALTPGGMSIGYDAEAMQRLLEIAPPGADELFAISRLADLIADESLSGVIVDTAPTGHFVRLLELPRTAGEWVRELMRLLLRYRELIPAGALGEELVRASRALKELDAVLLSDRASVIVVTRPERIVVAETQRLLDTLGARGLRAGGVIANYVTPQTACACDRSLFAEEAQILSGLRTAALIERRDTPPSSLAELVSLVPGERWHRSG